MTGDDLHKQDAQTPGSAPAQPDLEHLNAAFTHVDEGVKSGHIAAGAAKGLVYSLIETLGANKNKDYEIYLSATKVFFPISTLVNIGARYTSANEIGLTGFGECSGTGNAKTCSNDKEVRMEVSIAHLVAKNTAIGGEWQQHGSNLDGKSVRIGGLDASLVTSVVQPILPGVSNMLEQRKEGDWFDLFMAYAPNKNISFVVAYLMFSNISVAKDQNGFYFSTHLTF